VLVGRICADDRSEQNLTAVGTALEFRSERSPAHDRPEQHVTVAGTALMCEPE
jgi:hypothetical protein